MINTKKKKKHKNNQMKNKCIMNNFYSINNRILFFVRLMPNTESFVFCFNNNARIKF